MKIKTLLPGLLVYMFIVSSCRIGINPAPSSLPQPGATDIPDSDKPQIDHLTTSDGLSSNSVNAILQDNQGNMWFGTASGLDQYDGDNITVYRNDPDDPDSLRDNFITTLYVDENGILWAGSASGWLECYDRKHNHFAHNRISDKIWTINEIGEGPLTVYASGRIESDLDFFQEFQAIVQVVDWTSNIFSDSSGKEWWLYEDELYTGEPNDRDLWVPKAKLPPGSSGASKIIADTNGEIWIALDGGGLGCYKPENGEITVYRHDPGNPDSLIDDRVTSLLEAKPGYLWVGTPAGLNLLNTKTGQYRHIHTDPGDSHNLSDLAILSLYQDRTGTLWIGTESAGIYMVALPGAQFP